MRARQGIPTRKRNAVRYVGRGSSVQVNSGATISKTGSGWVLGDFLLACYSANDSATPSTPTGWTLGITRTAGGSTPAINIFGRFADGSADDLFTVPQSESAVNGRMLVFRNVDPTSPFADSNSKYSSTANTVHTVTGVTLPVPGCALIVMAASNSAGGTWDDLSGWVEHLESTGKTASTNIQSSVNRPSGATGNISLTRSTNIRSAMGFVALRPI